MAHAWPLRSADLESIRKRLDGAVLHYTSSEMLRDDLCLMCRNAMAYNDEGTEFYRYGGYVGSGRSERSTEKVKQVGFRPPINVSLFSSHLAPRGGSRHQPRSQKASSTFVILHTILFPLLETNNLAHGKQGTNRGSGGSTDLPPSSFFATYTAPVEYG